MDEQKTWMKNIDKISYAVAGVLAIGVLVVPLVLSGKVLDKIAPLETATAEIEPKISEPDLPRASEVQPLARALQEQWTTRPSATSPEWVTERRPILIEWQPVGVEEVAIHKPGHVAQVAHRRQANPDPDKMSYVEVQGVLSAANQNVVIQSVTLQRKVWDPESGEWGSFEPVRGFRADGDFTYQDYAIESGHKYGYAFTSTAVSTSPEKFQLEAGQKTQTSAECALEEAIPYDFDFAISLIRSETIGQPVVSAVVTYFDHEKGEAVKLRRTNYEEGDRFGPVVEGEKRYQVRRILPERGEVSIRDKLKPLSRPVITRKVRFSVQPIPPVQCSPVAEEAPEMAPGETTPADEVGAGEPAGVVEEPPAEEEQPPMEMEEEEPAPEEEEPAPTSRGKRSF